MKKTYLADVALSALVFAGAPHARSQTVAATGSGTGVGVTRPSGQLEQVVVTAQKRSERLQNVPVAVTAISAAQLQQTQVRNITDLSGTVPNFQISESGSGPNSSLISLRGLSFQDIEKSFEPPIGLVIDGVYLATSTGQVAQAFDFSSVEVLAGPQGTLFGKNTTGGVINITRSKPDPASDGIHGSFELNGGSFGEHDGQFVIRAPIIKDVLAIKVAGFSENNNGPYSAPYVGHNVGARDYQAYSVGVDYRPNQDSDIYTIFDRTLDHSGLAPVINADTPNPLQLPVQVPPGYPPFVDGRDTPCLNPYLPLACPNASGKIPNNVTTTAIDPKGAYNLYALTVNAYYNFDLFKLVSVTGYRSSSEDSQLGFDATPYNLYTVQRPEYYRQGSQEVRVESQLKGPLNFVAGIYLFDSYYALHETNDLDIAAVAPIPPGEVFDPFGSLAAQHAANEATFFQGTYDITSKLRLIFGARESFDQKHMDLQLYSDPNPRQLGFIECPNNTAGITQCQSVGKTHAWNRFTPKVGLQYRISPNQMAYASFTEGYNVGGFNGRAGNVALVGPYGPEIVYSYEAGYKSTWLHNRLRIDADVFWTNFDHAQEEIIQQLSNLTTSTTVANAANEVYRGFELEVAAKPVPAWTLTTNLGYLNAYYSQFNAALLAGPVTDNTNLTVRRAPPVTLGVTSDYIIPLPTGDVGLNVNLRYVDGQQFDLLNDPRGYQGPVSKLDLAARYETTIGGLDWTLTGYVKNVTNETPKNTFVTGYQGSFVEFWTQDIGRTFGASLRANF
jgi:iron complex outermembrane receptor protein